MIVVTAIAFLTKFYTIAFTRFGLDEYKADGESVLLGWHQRSGLDTIWPAG
jgi:hypothetical protein